MPGETPDLDRVREIARQQALASCESMPVGDTITLEELFRDVGQRLFVEGLTNDDTTTDEWARTRAEEFEMPAVDDPDKNSENSDEASKEK